MSKEKLTVESVSTSIAQRMFYDNGSSILENEIFRNKEEFNDLLKQIRDEIVEKRVESQSYYTSKAMQDINDVFNKYLNEKGGK